MLYTCVQSTRWNVENDESGIVTAVLAIVLTSYSTVALGRPFFDLFNQPLSIRSNNLFQALTSFCNVQEAYGKALLQPTKDFSSRNATEILTNRLGILPYMGLLNE